MAAARPRKVPFEKSSDASSEHLPTGETIADQYSVEEFGRLYNAYREGKYLLPNDGPEQDRLDLQHRWWYLVLDEQLHLAPVGEPADVLDIGTGTGIWALQFARKHPRSTVIGTDISLIQTNKNCPPNCTFEREDSTEEWIFDRQFDYIHWRMMCTCFDDFKFMFQKVFDQLKPGGWAEFHEITFELLAQHDDEEAQRVLDCSAFKQLLHYAYIAGQRMGRDFDAAKQFKHWLTELGFVDVVARQFLSPINGWPVDPKDKRIGNWYSLNALRFTSNMPKLLEMGGLPVDEIEAFQAQVRLDITTAEMRVYHPMYAVYARKPFPGEVAKVSPPVAAYSA